MKHYVPANLRAHVIQDDMEEWDTTVIAFEIELEVEPYPVPILLDGTDVRKTRASVFVEDQRGWAEWTGNTFDTLEECRESVKLAVAALKRAKQAYADKIASKEVPSCAFEHAPGDKP